MSFGRFHNASSERSQKISEIVLLHMITGFEGFITQCESKFRVGNFEKKNLGRR